MRASLMESWIVAMTFGGVGDRLAAQADRRGERRGDEKGTFETVVRSCSVGHEAAIVRYSPFVRPETTP